MLLLFVFFTAISNWLSSAQSCCQDNPLGYIAGDGNSCARYSFNGWCTLTGGYGPNWLNVWGTFNDYLTNGVSVVQACCVCGGGIACTVKPSSHPSKQPSVKPTTLPTKRRPPLSQGLLINSAQLQGYADSWANFSVRTTFTGTVYIYPVSSSLDLYISLETITTLTSNIITFGAPCLVKRGNQTLCQVTGLKGAMTYSVFFYGTNANPYTGIEKTSVVSLSTAPNPPSPVSAVFTSSAESILISLSGASDQGLSKGLTAFFPCSQLFIFVGPSLQCSWTSSSQVVFPTSTLVPGQMIQLRPGWLKAQCTSTTVICGYWPYCPALNLTIQGPASPIVPHIILNYNSKIGGITDIYLDASRSVGSGGRPMTYQWTLISPNSSNISLVLSKYPSTATSVTVPAALLNLGTTYSFNVQATNFLGQSASVPLAVTIKGNVLKAPDADHKTVVHSHVFYEHKHDTMKNRLHHTKKYYWYQTCGIHSCEKNVTYYFEPKIPDCSLAIANTRCTWQGKHCNPGLGCGISLTCLPRFAKPSCRKKMQ